MKNLFAFFLLLTTIVLNGCATLFCKSVSSISIDSDPPSANIKDKTGKVIGTTPYSFSPSKDESYLFTISKKGFAETELKVKPVASEGALFGDAMLLCLPCIIDMPSKAYLQFPRSSYKIDLQRIPSGQSEEEESSLFPNGVYVNINEPIISFKSGEMLGKVNSSKVKYNKDKEEETTGSSSSYTDELCNEFKEFNINSLKCGINRYQREGASHMIPDKQLFIQPVIESWSFDLIDKQKKYSGSGTMNITWQVMDPTQNMSVIRESKTKCTTDFEDRYLKYLFLKLIQRSVDMYVENDSVYNFIKNKNLLAGELMKGESVELTTVKNPSFDKLKDLISYCTKAVVTVKLKDGFGSGVIISQDGLIVTNYHVVEDNKEVTVKLSSGISMSAKVVKANPEADLALLRINVDGLTSLPLFANDVEVGEDVIAIGTPGNLSLEQTVSKGIVSGKRNFESRNFIQTDLSISPGNSGGPLLNSKGEVMGIITMKLVGKGMEGLGFALSSEEVIKLLNLKVR